MYEIWLALNIVWEIALTVWPALLLGMLAWLALMVLAGIASVLWLPAATRSSLGELAYWVDWANLLAIAAGFGAIALAFVWPLAASMRRPRP